MTGWGATDPKDLGVSDTLREVTVTIISRKLCNSPSYYNHHPIITKGLVCAGDAKGQKDSCQVRACLSLEGAAQRRRTGQVSRAHEHGGRGLGDVKPVLRSVPSSHLPVRVAQKGIPTQCVLIECLFIRITGHTRWLLWASSEGRSQPWKAYPLRGHWW